MTTTPIDSNTSRERDLTKIKKLIEGSISIIPDPADRQRTAEILNTDWVNGFSLIVTSIIVNEFKADRNLKKRLTTANLILSTYGILTNVASHHELEGNELLLECMPSILNYTLQQLFPKMHNDAVYSRIEDLFDLPVMDLLSPPDKTKGKGFGK